MNKINKTLIALAIAASFSACSKNEGTLQPTDVQKSDIKIVAGDNSRFVSYNTIEMPGATRASESIPDAPAIPEGAVNMMDIDGAGTKYEAWRAQAGTNYYLPAGAEYDGQLQFMEGVNYFIEGTLTLNFYGTKGELNILPNGTLKINGSTPSINNVTVNSWGVFDVEPSTNFIIGVGTSFINYSACEINASSMQNQGAFEHYGELTLAADLDCSGYQSSFTLHGSVYAASVKVSNTSNAYVTENVVTKTGVEVNSNSYMKVGASLVAENEAGEAAGSVYVTNNGVLDVADYIKTEIVKIDSNGLIITHIETLIMCDNLVYGNNTGKIHNEDMEGVYTVVVTKNLEAQDNIDRLSGGGMDLHTTPDQYENLGWTSNVIFNGPTYIPAKGLRPEYGIRPGVTEPVYTLEHVGSVGSVDRERISATSVDFVDGLAYFSWHLRGDEYCGYIDVANIGDRTLLSTLYSETQDFNNVIVTGGQICAVGADNAGALVSNINYSNSAVTADFSHIKGGSANSVLGVGNNKWVTTNTGITILPENKFISLLDAKYAVAVGDKVAVMAGVPDASLYIFDQNGEQVNSFSCGTISVEYGKNTIFADGDKVYVSLGADGLRSYDLNGNLLNEFTETHGGSVNSISADENFIYVACGWSGLHILDKKDFSIVKSYSLYSASANFVKKTSDGLLYVAYGLNGVHIFKLRVE